MYLLVEFFFFAAASHVLRDAAGRRCAARGTAAPRVTLCVTPLGAAGRRWAPLGAAARRKAPLRGAGRL